MTADQMAKKIVECVKQRPGATFVELIGTCGPEAEGSGTQLTLSEGSNIVLWRGASDLFAEALEIAKPHLEPRFQPQHLVLLAYMWDGCSVDLPLLTEEYLAANGAEVEEERWLPLTFTWREAKKGAATTAAAKS